MAAQSRDELDIIYDKFNKLASLCYPQYGADVINFSGGKVRHRPPLVKMRIAELFGAKDQEIFGFVKALTNNFTDQNTWNHESGHRVPSNIDINVSYQVIHKNVPQMLTKFYGIINE